MVGTLFTCARPGRSLGSKQTRINDKVVNSWIAGLPNSADEIMIISLLGRKPDGLSEFSYYSFRAAVLTGPMIGRAAQRGSSGSLNVTARDIACASFLR